MAKIDYTPRSERKVEEVTIQAKPCCVCGAKITTSYYGRWGNGGTCSKSCEAKQEDAQLYKWSSQSES